MVEQDALVGFRLESGLLAVIDSMARRTHRDRSAMIRVLLMGGMIHLISAEAQVGEDRELQKIIKEMSEIYQRTHLQPSDYQWLQQLFEVMQQRTKSKGK